MRKTFNQTEKVEVCKVYLDGKSIYSIAKEYDVTVFSIFNILKENNIEKQEYLSPLVDEEDQKKICKQYVEGKSLEDLGVEFEVNPRGIKGILKHYGVKIRTAKESIKFKKSRCRLTEESMFRIMEEYIDNKKTLSEIAKLFNISINSVKYQLQKAGIERRKAIVPSKTTIERDGKLYRICSSCKKEKVLDEFYNHKGNYLDKDYRCKQCSDDYKLCGKYNIDINFLRKLRNAKTVCEICGNKEKTVLDGKIKKLYIDHDPNKKGNQVCGVLCNNCNSAIGHLNHDPKIIKAAWDYIVEMANFKNRPFFNFEKIDFFNVIVRYKPGSRGIKAVYAIKNKHFSYLIEKQDCKCKVCDNTFDFTKQKTIHIDHDHKYSTKDKIGIRGILCENCNIGLGLLQDNVEIIWSAIEYVKRTRNN